MRNYDVRKNYFEDFRLCRICKTIQKYKILKLYFTKFSSENLDFNFVMKFLFEGYKQIYSI